MSVNPPLVGTFPQAYPGESFILTEDNVQLRVRTVRGSPPFRVECRRGTIFLSVLRAVFVESQTRFSFAMPLVLLQNIRAKLKCIGRPFVEGIVDPVPNQGLSGRAKFKLIWRSTRAFHRFLQNFHEYVDCAKMRNDSVELFSSSHSTNVHMCYAPSPAGRRHSGQQVLVTTTTYSHPSVMSPPARQSFLYCVFFMCFTFITGEYILLLTLGDPLLQRLM